ncbi:MAG: outer membrane protein beta-barrel domain, partial [Bacteroidota bacterium]
GFNKAGLSAAAFVRIDKGGPSAFQLEMGYVGKGSFKPADQENGDFDTWGFRFRYIQVPLLYVHSFTSFDLFAGPYGGYLISSRYQYNGNDLPIGNPEMQPFEIGGMFGAGMSIGDHLGVTARYSQSVLPIRQSPQTSFANAVIREKMVNIVAEVLLSYRF